MNEWLDKIIVSVLILWALGYVVWITVKKFKRPGCGDSCSCDAKKLAKNLSRKGR
ncbi:MAG: FeoB-associated Cys-rich membrane protein [Verrucomicrobiales bacterium]|jgi:hypothetical protein|nr:FeoB-associated Cys-rich membrane protein [Verrucomicrobiales bacterium]